MCRVLIADDEPKVLLLIKSLIEWEALGLELVATANDGMSALAAIAELRPDIVITDIRMPGYDGIELIGRAKAMNPATDFIIISGYRHFDYAQKAIRFGVEDYLLKPLKAVEINQTLRKMIEKYRDRDLAREREKRYSARAEKDTQMLHERFLVTAFGFGDDDEQSDRALGLEQINQKYALNLQAFEFQAFAVKADVGADSLGVKVSKLLVEKVVGAIRDAMKDRCHACLLYPSEHGVYGLLNFDESQKKALRKALLAVIDDLQSQSEIFDRIKVSVGLGRQSGDTREIRLSAQEAELAMLNRLVQGTGRILERPSADNSDFVVAQIVSADVRKRLLQSVEILDASAATSVIAGLSEAASKYEGMTGKAVLAIFDECMQILRFGLRAQNAVDAQIEALQSSALEKLGMCHSQREVFLLLGAYTSNLVEHVVALRRSESAKPVRDAQKFIQANFASPIGLESVSEQVGFNPTYFSLVFKKETGMNFLEYLTEVRIREAKRLLSDPRKTIADVAFEVGYSDVKHFSRVFTRSTGLHPSKYRKLYY
ncbi:MAG: response regulator [Propionivibrio sp.]